MKRRYAISTLLILTAIVAIAIRIGMKLDPRVIIRGDVITSQSQPLENVRVLIKSQTTGSVSELSTDKDGRYQFGAPEQGSYLLWIEDDNWVTNQYEVLAAEKGRNQVPSFNVTRGATVSVRLYDAVNGGPWNMGSLVQVKDPRMPSEIAKHASIASDGSFTIRLAPGKNSLEFGNYIFTELEVEDLQQLDLEYLVMGRELNPIVRNGDTGHCYAFMEAPRAGSTFDAVRTLAGSLKFEGMGGHLVTITSGEEQEFLLHQFAVLSDLVRNVKSMTTPLGGSDKEEEGVWRWVCGPEKGRVFYRAGERLAAFQAWDAPRQPDNFGGENYLTMDFNRGARGGCWNDIARVSAYRFLVEFSPEVELPPEPRAVMSPDTSDHPTSVDAVCVSYDDVFRVAGFSVADMQWYVWESPAIPPPGVNSYFRFTHSSNLVAFTNGWLLDLKTRQWTQFQPRGLLHAFVGEQLLTRARTRGLLDPRSGNWMPIAAAPPRVLSGSTRRLADGRLYLWGKDSGEPWGTSYDFDEGDWKSTAGLQDPNMARVRLWNDWFVAWQQEPETYKDYCQLVHQQTGESIDLPAPPIEEPSLANVLVLGDRMVCCFHGASSMQGMKVLAFDLKAMAWLDTPESPYPWLGGGWLAHPVGSAKILFGFGTHFSGIAHTAIYDVIRNKWIEAPDLPLKSIKMISATNSYL